MSAVVVPTTVPVAEMVFVHAGPVSGLLTGVNQMTLGRFLLPGGGPIVREPAQFAAGFVYRLYEASAASYSLFGTEVVCDERGNPPR